MVFEETCLCVFKSLDNHKLPVFPQSQKTTFLSQKLANTRSTKAKRDSAAVHESQPTPATLLKGKKLTRSNIFMILD